MKATPLSISALLNPVSEEQTPQQQPPPSKKRRVDQGIPQTPKSNDRLSSLSQPPPRNHQTELPQVTCRPSEVPIARFDNNSALRSGTPHRPQQGPVNTASDRSTQTLPLNTHPTARSQNKRKAPDSEQPEQGEQIATHTPLQQHPDTIISITDRLVQLHAQLDSVSQQWQRLRHQGHPLVSHPVLRELGLTKECQEFLQAAENLTQGIAAKKQWLSSAIETSNHPPTHSSPQNNMPP